MTNTNTKTKKATVSKTLNKNVKVERFSQVMQDGSINWSDEASSFLSDVKSVKDKMYDYDLDCDRKQQALQLYYGYVLSTLYHFEAQTTDKNGKFTKPKRISNNVFNDLIIENLGQYWYEKHANNITAYRQVYEITQVENFDDWFKPNGFAEDTDFEITKPQVIKFFGKFDVSIIHITFAKDFTGIFYPSLKTLYSKYGFKINKDGQPEKRELKASNGANKRKEEKPTDKKANAEKAVQMVKGFLDAMGLKPSDKMEAISIFGQTVEKLAQIEANKK